MGTGQLIAILATIFATGVGLSTLLSVLIIQQSAKLMDQIKATHRLMDEKFDGAYRHIDNSYRDLSNQIKATNRRIDDLKDDLKRYIVLQGTADTTLPQQTHDEIGTDTKEQTAPRS